MRLWNWLKRLFKSDAAKAVEEYAAKAALTETKKKLQ